MLELHNRKVLTLLKVGGGVAGGQGEHHVLRPVKWPQQERDVLVWVGEVLPLVGEGEDNVSVEAGGLPTGPGQEEGVRALSVISEVFDEDVVLVQGIGHSSNIVVNVSEWSNFHWKQWQSGELPINQ